ncbi:MAG: metallophosphoesterase [Verrucomicrobia bacterium]|nr:MAG: metallophosphoesterase [Verrucomicrobiota bacterium]
MNQNHQANPHVRSPRVSRRRFLGTGALGAAGMISATALAARETVRPPVDRGARVLRIAHLTDVHILPGKGAAEGLAAALRQAQAAGPDFVFFGGDLIMDALKVEKDEALAQWVEWHRVVGEELHVEPVYALGNHDVWGWALPKGRRAAASADPLYGKAMAMEQLGMKDRYYSFDRAGWHFIVLDSAHFHPEGGRGYRARLDDEQFAWLARDLEQVARDVPVCVLSHIPLLSVCAFFDGDNEATGDWVVPGEWAHIDARRIKDLFRKHRNVRVCLSGHIHLADDVRYLDVRYCCNGAVCGAWWDGAYQEFPPAYAIVDLYEDGSVENRLIPWRRRA